MVDNSPPKKQRVFNGVLRFLLALVGLFLCYHFSVATAALGISRLFSTMSIVQSSVPAADTAVRFAPDDPEAHYTRGLALVNAGRLNEAAAELQQATQLRPHYYYEWLDLGVTRDRLGDQVGAVAAIRESVRLAPFFAQPRWQLGNLLFRQGQFEEAFAELRLGAASNPNLYESMMQLAWVATDGDVGKFEALVRPDSRESHFWLASFLAKSGKGADAARQIKEAGVPTEEWERRFLHQTIIQLLAAEQFSDAYAAWAATHPGSDKSAKGQILNGNFVETIVQDDPGFGWQLALLPNVSISIDPSGPTPSARSLRLQFGGDNPPANQLVNQIVLLDPNSRYTLTFMAKSEELVTGGPAVISVLAPGANPKILGQSGPLSPPTSGWTTYRVDFSVDEKMSAVVVALQRLPCNQSPCPIFGRLWLSGFSLSKA